MTAQETGAAMVLAVKNYVACVLAPILIRVVELERRAPLAIHASGDVKIDGLQQMDSMARSVADLNRTLASPVRPVYDAAGKLIGAARQVESSGDLHALEARIEALELAVKRGDAR